MVDHTSVQVLSLFILLFVYLFFFLMKVYVIGVFVYAYFFTGCLCMHYVRIVHQCLVLMLVKLHIMYYKDIIIILHKSHIMHARLSDRWGRR